MKKLINQLQNAEGRSEFIIALMCDIRGFSQFSTIHESPDLAMFIKRFYLKLMQVYFSEAVFAKPTGDGLLIVSRYSEKSLATVSEKVLSKCFQVLNDFPKMFQDDPMINFDTPANLGFGIARGTACCLFNKRAIIDYSGQLLNLAARLNDLARPRGIVLDGAYIDAIIPKQFRNRFVKKHAYIKSLAEESPIQVLCSEEVVLPAYALSPITSHQWLIKKRVFKVAELLKVDFNMLLDIPREIMSMDKTKLQFNYPNVKLPGYSVWIDYRPYECFKDATGTHLRFDVSQAKSVIVKDSLTPETEVSFEFQYVPKPKKIFRRRA